MQNNLDSQIPDYLHIGNAKDIKNKKDRILYRAFEILPGFLVWFTFALVVFLSYTTPLAMSILILAFAFYWLLKSFYLALHTKSGYNKMPKTWGKRVLNKAV